MNQPNPQSNETPQVMDRDELCNFVKTFFGCKHRYLDSVAQYGSPLYLLETSVIRERVNLFRDAFDSKLPKTSYYYAMKSNNLPQILKTVLEQGFGLDVSSGQELQVALDLGAKDIIFSGPGKMNPELELAVENRDRVTLLLDSVGEYQRLGTILEQKQCTMEIGVRLNHNPKGLWRKFGILLEELPSLYEKLMKHPYMEFKGLQFHSSWNLSPERQCSFIETLGAVLTKMPSSFVHACEFLDIGGGYWPSQGEWLISEDPLQHYKIPAVDIDDFAIRLSDTIQQHILSWMDCRICFEPGRWICNDAMHILCSVVERKASDLVITDAGTNSVGWERFETDYFPVLNLTRSAMTEKPCHVLGSLCTPHDVWGYAYFGRDIREGDVLMIPTQGAYTYSLRQNFIKPLPQVIVIE